MKQTLICILLCIGFISCNEKEIVDNSRTPILEVGGRFLYLDQVEALIPEGSTKQDSTVIAEKFIKSWVTEVLMFKHAEDNITNTEEIDVLVDNYRKSLVIHHYQQNLIQERLKNNITDEDLLAFYENNKAHYLLKENIIQGLYIKVPVKAPNLKELRSWLKNLNQANVEKIEKYRIKNATNYIYFADNWVPFIQIAVNMPKVIENQSGKGLTEQKDEQYYYFLSITNSKKIGEVEPFDIAKAKINEIFFNKKKIEYISQFENELYNDAVSDEEITYFIKK